MAEKLFILLMMMVCLFGPMAIFTLVGNKALTELGKRPSEGSAVMIPFIFKLMAGAAICIGILMIMLKVMGPENLKDAQYRFNDMEWRLQNV